MLDFLLLILGINSITFAYFGYKFMQVIDEISKQRLIYDETTGRYIRLRQIK